ncbi:MAG: CoA ester lyase [Chloroflexota bacterium]
MKIRRTLLYMPATDWRKIEKATTLSVDSICMDLEDGVVENRKDEARETAVKALQTLNFSKSEVFVRINKVGSGLEKDDLQAVIPAAPQGIVIPKVEKAADIHKVAQLIDKYQQSDQDQPPILLIAIIETALGIVNLKEICEADQRLQALIFGAEDLAGDIGAVRTPPAWEVFYARSAVVTHAAAFGLQPIDMLSTDFRNLENLIEQTEQGMQMGYTGVQIIHPNQIEAVHQVFAPSDEEVAQAEAIVAAHIEHQAAGTGAFALNGKMVDQPVVRGAEHVLARAKAAGKL